MRHDDDKIIPLRWHHLTFGEQQLISQTIPDDYRGWEIRYGLYTRIDGQITFVEDCTEH